MLVPTATLAEHRRHQLAREGLVFRPDLIQTFSRYAANLAGETRQVSEPLLHLTVETALRELDAHQFQPVNDAPGFPASVAAAIGRLDTAGLQPRELERVCHEFPYAIPLAKVWQSTLDRLRESGLTLRSGVLAAATRAAAAQPASLTLLLDGFRKFSEPERKLLQALGADPEPALITSPAPPEVQRFAADSDRREAEEIARQILSATVPFQEIGIAVRNPERSVAVLRPVLERFGIPARFYFSEPLADNAALRFFSATIEAFLSGWDHALCLPALRLAPGFPPEALDRFDFQIREQLPNGGLTPLRDLQPDRRVGWLLADWETLSRNWNRRAAPRRWAAQLSQDLTRLYRPQNLIGYQPWATEEWERRRASAVSLFPVVLEEAATLWPESAGPVSLLQFWQAAKTAIEHTPLRIADRRRNVVHVMSVYEARQWQLDTVFLCGLAEKQFPRRHGQDPFLPDLAMEKLKRAGWGVETSSDRDVEEESLFHMAVSSARTRVVLSYAAEGKNGPSPFWGESDAVAVVPELVRPAPPERSPARRQVTRIADEGLRQWMATQRHATFSVTALENHLACPFRFFASHTLKLRAVPPRPEKRLTFLEEGIIVHQVLEEWLPERPPIRTVLERVFSQTCEQKRIIRGYRTETSYAIMLSNLERFAEASAVWPRNETCQVEKQLEFAVADGINIRARIDRIERLPDGGLIIIDYKYSSAANTKGKVDDSTRLQGPLYVRGIALAGESVAAMVYFSLKGKPEAFGWGIVPGLAKELEALTPEWVARGVAETGRAVEAVRSGLIAVLPSSKDACSYCDAKDVCRVETGAALSLGQG